MIPSTFWQRAFVVWRFTTHPLADAVVFLVVDAFGVLRLQANIAPERASIYMHDLEPIRSQGGAVARCECICGFVVR